MGCGNDKVTSNMNMYIVGWVNLYWWLKVFPWIMPLPQLMLHAWHFTKTDMFQSPLPLSQRKKGRKTERKKDFPTLWICTFFQETVWCVCVSLKPYTFETHSKNSCDNAQQSNMADLCHHMTLFTYELGHPHQTIKPISTWFKLNRRQTEHVL